MVTEEYLRLKERVLSRNEAQDVIHSLGLVGFWVKSLDFKFLDISDKASKILYGIDSDDCIGFTDLEIAKNLGLSKEKELQFATVCRASDLHVINNPKNDYYPVYHFIEFLKDTNGINHIWRTLKGIYPEGVKSGKYYWGAATFMDELIGYEKALGWAKKETQSMKKLSDNLFVYE